jgi:hypothetical protein
MTHASSSSHYSHKYASRFLDRTGAQAHRFDLRVASLARLSYLAGFSLCLEPACTSGQGTSLWRHISLWEQGSFSLALWSQRGR